MTSSMLITDTHWNVPYLFKGASIVQDAQSWIGGERLVELFDEKLLAFRLGRRQKSLFGS